MPTRALLSMGENPQLRAAARAAGRL